MKKKTGFFVIIALIGVIVIGFIGFKVWKNSQNTQEDDVKLKEINGVEVFEESNGHRYEKDIVIVFFKEGTTKEDISTFIQTYDVQVEEETVGRYVVKFKQGKSAKELQETIVAMEKESIIDLVTLSFMHTTQSFETSKWNYNAIQLMNAWDKVYKTTQKPVKIGIIDAGFYLNHEDLAIPNENVFTYDEHVLSKKANENEHGTHVTGIVSASVDNGVGIDGIVRVQDTYLYKTDGTDTDIQKAILLLAEKGVKVINISLGNALDYTDLNREKYIEKPRDSYTKFLAEQVLPKYDVLIVQSAGNDGIGAEWNGIVAGIEEEKIREHVLVVGSFGQINNAIDNMKVALAWKNVSFPKTDSYYLAKYSNTGSYVDVLAPGENILSTTESKTGYGKLSGTSQAAPHVAGLAAMLMTLHPTKTSGEIKESILNGSTTTIAYDGNKYRVLNANQAVDATTGALSVPPPEDTSSFIGYLLPVIAIVILMMGAYVFRRGNLMKLFLIVATLFIIFYTLLMG